MSIERDFSGLSGDDDALQTMIRDLDSYAEQCLNQSRKLLIDHGATQAELDTEIQIQRAQIEQWRRERIKELRSWLGLSLH